MTVWVASYHHRAEGEGVMGVFSSEPTKEQLDELLRTRCTCYEPAEKAEWCQVFCQVFEVEEPK